LFGAPIAHEDHALRACYAALAMQTAMQPYTEEVRRTRGLELRMRVGLNSGEVVVRAIGNDLHMDYSAVGETTHLAARMEQPADRQRLRARGRAGAGHRPGTHPYQGLGRAHGGVRADRGHHTAAPLAGCRRAGADALCGAAARTRRPAPGPGRGWTRP